MLYLKTTKSGKFGDSYQTQSEFYVNPILILKITLRVKLKISSDNIANDLRPSITKIQNKNSKRTVFRIQCIKTLLERICQAKNNKS